MHKRELLWENSLVQNVFIWLCLFFVFTLTIQSETPLLAGLIGVLLMAPPIYIENLLILPLASKGSGRFVMATLLNILFFTFLNSWFLATWVLEVAIESRLLYNFLGLQILAVLFGLALKIARDSVVRKSREREAELQLLKAQLNPHFLFNTLNNLYGLSVIKSDKLPELMLQLSQMLRYSLYETKEQFVNLDKEIAYLTNYVALEKIRLESSSEVTLELRGDYRQFKIAPMLLIVFVENAFKYLGETSENRSFVTIAMETTGNQLHFSCTNSYNPSAVAAQMSQNSGGIGLENAKKRLALLYPDAHQLYLKEEAETYNVKLIINL